MKVYQSDELTRDEMNSLFAIALTSTTVIKHDLISPVGAILNGAEMISEYFTARKQNDESDYEFSFAKDVADTLLKAALIVRERIINLDRFLPTIYKGKSQFIAAPHIIFKSMIDIYNVNPVHIGTAIDNADLYLVFPHCALYSLFYELIGNSVKHGASRVEVSWQIVDNRFLLNVSDDGPGLTKSLNEEYIDLSSVTRLFLSEHKLSARGLGFVNNILYYSKGYAKVKRSHFSGTEIDINFPILGIWHKDALPGFER